VDGGPDELSGGARRDPPRMPRWLPVTAAVVAAVAIAYATVRVESEPTPTDGARPPSSRSSVAAPSSPGASAVRRPSGPLVLAGVTCVVTRPRGFTIVLGLQNAGPDRVTVLSVSPSVPTGGLSAIGGRAPARRTCGGVDVDPGTRLVLEPGDRLPVSLSFETPKDCPAAHPVAADVDVIGSHETPETQRVPVLADLSGHEDRFAACSV
jgi:hypothetical protein